MPTGFHKPNIRKILKKKGGSRRNRPSPNEWVRNASLQAPGRNVYSLGLKVPFRCGSP
jgi:hypothetical protein